MGNSYCTLIISYDFYVAYFHLYSIHFKRANIRITFHNSIRVIPNSNIGIIKFYTKNYARLTYVRSKGSPMQPISYEHHTKYIAKTFNNVFRGEIRVRGSEFLLLHIRPFSTVSRDITFPNTRNC